MQGCDSLEKFEILKRLFHVWQKGIGKIGCTSLGLELFLEFFRNHDLSSFLKGQ